jgi:hypothetical protein
MSYNLSNSLSVKNFVIPGPTYYEIAARNNINVAKGILSNMFKPPFDSSSAKITAIEQ